MIQVTWLEIMLLSVFAGTLALSVGFCLNNYARSGHLLPARRDRE